MHIDNNWTAALVNKQPNCAVIVYLSYYHYSETQTHYKSNIWQNMHAHKLSK